MPVQLICCSHSPLMTTGIEESGDGAQARFFSELANCAEAVRAFDPELVVVFGPDHFNGLFYDLMPAFCIGTAAESTKDWHLEAGPLRVPRAPRLRRCAVACHEGRSRRHHPALQADRRARLL
jgi:2,3-dihydroxyphenylpropionate 1,2-dioxygenase